MSSPLKRAGTFTLGVLSPRNIAAPFQIEETSKVNAHEQGDFEENIDYHNFSFTPLEDSAQILFEKYCGPTPESNWVIPGVLLVGAYPASQDDAETFDLITSILKLGVTKFVCLQQEYRSHGVTEAMWRSGQALRPYFNDVRRIVQMKHRIPELAGHNIVDESMLSFVHFPIKDCGITDDSRVLELARNLVEEISRGEMLYLHCWGGHGRTGTLVCIMLHLMYGLDAIEAMARCQLVHDLRQCPVEVGSPQTQAQRDQVTRIINRVSRTDCSVLRRTLSDVNEHAGRTDSPVDSPQPSSPRSAEAQVIMHAQNAAHPHLHNPLGNQTFFSESDEGLVEGASTTSSNSCSSIYPKLQSDSAGEANEWGVMDTLEDDYEEEESGIEVRQATVVKVETVPTSKQPTKKPPPLPLAQVQAQTAELQPQTPPKKEEQNQQKGTLLFGGLRVRLGSTKKSSRTP